MHDSLNNPAQRSARCARRRGRPDARRRPSGFTLIEMLIALSILMLMLTIIFVPLNLGINFFNIGNSRSQVQQDTQFTLTSIANDLRQAIFVYPNDAMPGITDHSPYTDTINTATIPVPAPYFQSNQTDVFSATGTQDSKPFGNCTRDATTGNTGRLDFILPAMTNGVPTTPVVAGAYQVTYYGRRVDLTREFDGISNPMVLYRAQYPFRNGDGSPYSAPGTPSALNADTTGNRYSSAKGGTDRGSVWLVQDKYGEPDLERLCTDAVKSGFPTVIGNHENATPRGMVLIAPHALDDTLLNPSPNTKSYVPDTSFLCSDTDGDGKIDHIKITMVVGQFDAAGASQNAQTVRLSEDVDLPNIQ